MARKTKEELKKIDEEIVEKSTKKAVKTTNKNKTAVKSKSAAKSVVKKEPAKKVASSPKNENPKNENPKNENPKKENLKKENLKKETPKKETAKKKTTKKETVKKAMSSSKKELDKKVKAIPKTESSKKVKTISKKEPAKNVKTTPKKEATKKVKNKETETKKLATTTKKKAETKKASTTTKKKAETKKASTTTKKKTGAKKISTTKKKSTVKKASTTKKKTTTKESGTNSNVVSISPIEYYDLPYRYNETIVKVLAQNPNTLFVYWDISDNDRENLENQYGKLFFYNTRPVLVIHNLTDNYSFEIDIDDFANNWYVNVHDTKCKYFVELGRRPKYENHDAIPVNYLKVASSNTIEMPNDHILFFKDNDKIYFKNIKTNRVTEKIFKSKTYSNKLKGIYSNYNLSEKDDRFDFKNPSSQNPTSNVL